MPMSGLENHQARARAAEILEVFAAQACLPALVILDDAVIETPDAFYFPYQTADLIIGGELRDALAGNVTLRISRDGGEHRFEAPPQ
jgi:hypothetical protein